MLLLLLGGCNPDRTRWQSEYGISTNIASPTVSAYLAPVTPTTGNNSKAPTLSDKAQAAAITQLAKMSKDFASFKKNFDTFFKPSDPSGAGNSADDTILTRTLVISIGKNGYRPADRIVSAIVTVEPVDFSFTGYTIVATDYDTVAVDKIDQKAETSGTIDLNPTLSGSVKGPIDVKGGVDVTNDHQYNITDIAPKPYVELQPCKLVLHEGSEPNQDISGTTLIKLTLVANSVLTAPGSDSLYKCVRTDANTNFNATISDLKLYDDSGKPLAPAKASLTTLTTISRAGPLYANIKMDYVYRYVSTGDKTPIEDDDTVRFYYGTVYATDDGGVGAAPGKIGIIDGGRGADALWALKNGTGNEIEIEQPGVPPTPLRLTSLLSATQLVTWMQTTKSWRIGKYTLSNGLYSPSMVGLSPELIPN